MKYVIEIEQTEGVMNDEFTKRYYELEHITEILLGLSLIHISKQHRHSSIVRKTKSNYQGMDELFYKIHSKRSIQTGNQLCESDVSTVVEKNKEEGTAELSRCV